jgi:addiction module HigA family antidote
MDKKSGEPRIPTHGTSTHPGEMLREEFLLLLGLSAKNLAREIGVPEADVVALLDRQRAVTPDLAKKLADRFDTTPAFWLNLQIAYDQTSQHRTLSEKLRPYYEEKGPLELVFRKNTPVGLISTVSTVLSDAHAEELLLLGYFSDKISRFSLSDSVYIERRSTTEDAWAIVKMRYVRTRPTRRFPTGVWVYEPLPSNRSSAFIRHTRFTKIEALKLAMAIVHEDPYIGLV